MRMRALLSLLLAIAPVGGCDDPAPASGFVVTRLDANGLPAALATAGATAIVGTAQDAQAAIGQRNPAAQPMPVVVAIGDAENSALLAEAGVDVLVTPNLAALTAAAADLTVLMVSGVPIPERTLLGATWLTRANRAAGGQVVPAPSEFGLAALRLQHGAELDPHPATDVVFRIGVLTHDLAPQHALPVALAQALRRFAQCEVTLGSEAAVVAADGVSAVLFVGNGHAQHAALAQQLKQRGVRTLAVASDLLDAALTATVQADEQAMAQAVADALRARLPQQARVFLAHSLPTSVQDACASCLLRVGSSSAPRKQ